MSAFIDKFIHRVRTRGNVVGIGFADDPTYHRYFVIPRNRFFNVYLHRFRHSDFEHLHDHRMANISIILKGYYYEQRFVKQPIAGEPLPDTRAFIVEAMRPLFRRASTPHRVVLAKELGSGVEVPVWSLFIGFRQARNWGFWRSVNGAAYWMPHQCLTKDYYQPTADAVYQRKQA
jgi:hypothetical protein